MRLKTACKIKNLLLQKKLGNGSIFNKRKKNLNVDTFNSLKTDKRSIYYK